MNAHETSKNMLHTLTIKRHTRDAVMDDKRSVNYHPLMEQA